MEPVDVRRGVDAIRTAALVIVPALAVDRSTGVRLGQGGGSYDRALARVGPNVPTVALLHDGELLDGVPAEPHDRPVRHAALPGGIVRLGEGRPAE
jgi:5-formyltetrahydrofolate cyclo-ligase